jgi:electron transport complex protein RnfB
MTDDAYRKLAQRLDAIPNSFPASESGVELRLLAKLFAPEEAALASVMRLIPETPTDIAASAGVDPEVADRLLGETAQRGLIDAWQEGGQRVFRLRPFLLDILSAQLPRMDVELATLLEEYYDETRAGIVRDAPSLHRVVPVGEAIPVDLGISPYERITEMIEKARSWGVRDCICRVQQHLIGKGCDRPVENCLSFAPVEGAFSQSGTTRAISKEEALRIMHEAEEAGLVHTVGNYRDGVSYVCNCCMCCCAILRGVSEYGNPSAVARSGFRAAVDAELCTGCGTCLDRCPFDALSVPEDVCVVEEMRCVGCGLCTTVCPTDALGLQRLPEEAAPAPPVDPADWMRQRAQTRGIDLSELL